MSVTVDIIGDESCDHCSVTDDRPLIRFKFRGAYNEKLQLWLHPECLEKLTAKANKLLAQETKKGR